MKRAFLAFVMVALTSTASFGQKAVTVAKGTPKKPPSTKVDTRKTIGFVSEIGTQFEVQKIGIMIFGNEKTSVPIDSWGIDALANTKVTASAKARFNIVSLKLSREGSAALASAPGSLFGDRDGHICNVLRKETLSRTFDYYLRLKPKESAYANTNQFVRGLGIVHRDGLGSGYTFVHALFEMELLDGKSCSVIRSEEPASNQDFLFGQLHGPSREVEASWMPVASGAVTDNRLKEATRTLVEQGLTQTIPRVLAAGQ